MPRTDNAIPENSKENLDRKLDHAIKETFPTSDPVSVKITKGGAIDYDEDTPSSDQGLAGTAGDLLHRAQESAQSLAGSAAEAARGAYSQGSAYMRQAADRYPAAERYYREGSRMVSRQVAGSPLVSLLAAGAVGYALAWLIHGSSVGRNEGVQDHARTRRGYTPHRGERRHS